MQMLKQAIPMTASHDSVLDVILNPLRLPEWSLFIKSVTPIPGGYTAETLSGPLEFYWFVNRKNYLAIRLEELSRSR
jgi:hypothetical protein